MSLIPFASFGGDDVGVGKLALSSRLSSLSQKMPRDSAQGGSFTAGGTETVSVSREAGNFVR